MNKSNFLCSVFFAFIDLMKAFDPVCKSGLFQLLKNIGCPPPKAALHHRATSAQIRSIPCQQWSQAGLRACPHTLRDLLLDAPDPRLQQEQRRSLGRLLNLASLRFKIKVRHVTILEALSADCSDTTHRKALQILIYRFVHACSPSLSVSKRLR